MIKLMAGEAGALAEARRKGKGVFGRGARSAIAATGGGDEWTKGREGGAFPSNFPIHSADLEFAQQGEMILTCLVKTCDSVLWKREVQDKSGVRVLSGATPDLAL
jgi:hypothetical protein